MLKSHSEEDMMKKMNNIQILLLLFSIALAIEVVILARQNMILKEKIHMQSTMMEKGPEIKNSMWVPPIPVTGLDLKEYEICFQGKNKRTLLYFFSLSCPQCLRNIPKWRKLTEALKDDPTIQIYGIVKDHIEPVREYAEGYSLNYNVTVNSLKDSTLYRDYGIKYVPTTMLIDDSSKIVLHYTGVLSNENEQEILISLHKKR
jgi:peroxiredoxin